ncbi:replicative DNA helicase [Leptospirillum ferrooxidans]|jgi:replicative DNA helicase|uniref:Replicative DNA helicase n=1 Tax=Leptospirillum ferrooxidans (strain C2-3) TaxID=1162668 RepID=I0INN9_LEPFC|nr:replicative DNA helicase [Leptospirillum ferrooxidans]BAM06888.1 DnaB helicase [Leptospirillum ferrooxidans C2-3]
MKNVRKSGHEVFRNLPQSIEAEKSFLGSILLNNEVLTQIGDSVKEEDFILDAHRKIYQVMREMAEVQHPIDPVTLSDRLKKKGWDGLTGAPQYIEDLSYIVPTAANAKHYARLLTEKGIYRKLILAAEDIAQKGYEETEEVESLLDLAERKILEIGSHKNSGGFVKVGDVPYLDTQFKKLEELRSREIADAVIGLPTGFIDLDRMTTGLYPSDLIIVAGRPAMGKTAFAMGIAQYVSFDLRLPVGIFSLEMSKEQLFMRLISSQSRVDAWKLRTGQLPSDDWRAVMQAFGEASDVPLFIDDSGDLSVYELRARARRLKAQNKNLSLIVVDYLQLVKGSQRTDNREQEISEISRSLKALAKELNLPVIALAQLSRSVENRPKDKKPILSDLRESGAIEQDADIVLFIYRDEVYNKENLENKGKAEVIIGKQRNGPIGSVNLAFLGHCTRFENLAYGYDNMDGGE